MALVLSVLALVGAAACLAFAWRVERRLARWLAGVDAHLLPLVRRALQEEREGWAREILRRETVARALEEKSQAILESRPREALPDVTKRVAEQFDRDAGLLMPALAEIMEARRILYRQSRLAAEPDGS